MIAATSIQALHSAQVGKPRILFASTWRSDEVATSVLRHAHAAGWHLDVTSFISGEWPDTWDGDGIVAVIGDNPHLRRLISSNRCPSVSLSVDCSGLDLHAVDVDNQRVGELAADHTLARAFRHFIYYSHTDWPVDRLRHAGFVQRLQQAGRDCIWWQWRAQRGNLLDSWGNRQLWLINQLRQCPKPVAIMAVDDLRAVEIVEAGLQAGLRIPEDVAVIGVGDHHLLTNSTPVAISSVAIDWQHIGKRAVQLLGHLMRGEQPGRTPQLVPPLGIISRTSTDIVVAKHPEVAKAVRFMLDRYQQSIRICDIVNATSLAQTTLYQHFQHDFAQSPMHFLSRLRLDFAKRLLADPALSLTTVAQKSGFGNLVNLFRTFQRLEKTNPTRYRTCCLRLQ